MGGGVVDARGKEQHYAQERFLACQSEIVNAAERLPRRTGSGRGGLAENNHLLAGPNLHELDFQDPIGQ